MVLFLTKQFPYTSLLEDPTLWLPVVNMASALVPLGKAGPDALLRLHRRNSWLQERTTVLITGTRQPKLFGRTPLECKEQRDSEGRSSPRTAAVLECRRTTFDKPIALVKTPFSLCDMTSLTKYIPVGTACHFENCRADCYRPSAATTYQAVWVKVLASR